MKDIKLPIVGETNPAVVIIGGLVVAGGIWLYYRHQQNASSSIATPSSGTSGSVIDPATGYPEGSPQDLAALADSSGDDSGLYGDDYDGSGSDIDPSTGYVSGSPQDLQALQQLYGTGTTTASTVPTTNAQWSQDVQSTLTAIGYNGRNVSVAVGDFLGRKPLDANQQQIIQTALAEVGPPPSGSYTIVAAREKPSKPGNQVREHTTGGAESLNALAKSWKNTPEEVTLLTDANGGHQAKWTAYEKTHNFNAKVPAGIHLYYEVK